MPIVVPKLRLAVLCAHVEFDRDGRPFRLQEPLHTVVLPKGHEFPFIPATMMFYAQLQDALGTFRFRVELRSETGIVVCDTRPPIEITFTGTTHRADPAEAIFKLDNFQFPAAGVYEFHLVCNQTSMHEPRWGELSPFPVPRLNVLRTATLAEDSP